MHQCHYTDLAEKWTIKEFQAEENLTEDEINRAVWTSDSDVEDGKEAYWITVDLHAFLMWIDDEPEQVRWKRVCQGCGQSHRQEGTTQTVELPDGRQVKLWLCDLVCYPDFWDDVLPGEWVELHDAYPDGETLEVRLPYWMCVQCSSMCPFGMMDLMLDTNYNPPEKTIVCSSCIRKEKERFQPVP